MSDNCDDRQMFCCCFFFNLEPFFDQTTWTNLTTEKAEHSLAKLSAHFIEDYHIGAAIYIQFLDINLNLVPFDSLIQNIFSRYRLSQYLYENGMQRGLESHFILDFDLDNI